MNCFYILVVCKLRKLLFYYYGMFSDWGLFSVDLSNYIYIFWNCVKRVCEIYKCGLGKFVICDLFYVVF